MFVDPTRGRSQGFALVAAAAGALALGACNDPEQNTDLRPDGDPEVLAVLVMNDAASQLVETATYCAPNDEKRPNVVGLPDFTAPNVCPDDLATGATEVTNAYPDGWYVRIMFDELLNPDIEELTEVKDPSTGEGTDTYTGSIANTHPVKLECESVGGGFVEVPYDGYYSPAGNAVTWPLGPSLVIQPNAPKTVATGKACRITINENVVDKSGNKVPATQRGPFPFKIAEPTILATDPTDSGDEAEPAAVDALALYFDNPYLQFNTEINVSSLCKDTDNPLTDAGAGLCDGGTEAFEITPSLVGAAGGGWGYCNVSGDPCDTAADCTDPADTRCDSAYAYTYSGVPLSTEFGFGFNAPLATDTTYTVGLKAGTKVTDRCGVETTLPAPTAKNLQKITFHTNKFALKTTKPSTGDTVAMVSKPSMTFTNYVDVGSLSSTEYSITPAPAAATLGQSSGGDIIFGGNYAPDTTYTLTINAGAKVSDAYGVETTIAEAKTVMFKTQPKVSMTTTSPAAGAVVQKLVTGQVVGVTLGFNANMDVTTLTAADFTFVNSSGVAVTPSISTGTAGSFANCSATSLSCTLRIRANLPPDTYTFTLKAGAEFKDKLGNAYTQAADKVIKFTVKDPVAPITCL